MSGGAGIQGRATALTLISQLRLGGRTWLRILFWLATWLPLPRWTLLRLKAIHFARWTILAELPPGGPRRERARLPRSLLLFESNFNGTWDGYIEAFSYVFPKGMRAIWGSSDEFPGAVPAARLKEWVRPRQVPAAHYYAACPEASTREVLAALELSARLDSFERETRDSTPEEFRVSYDRLLIDLQRQL